MTSASFPTAEFPLRPSHFRIVAGLMYDVAGVNLQTGKESLVRSRLSPRLRALGLSTFDEYLELVTSDEGRAELGNMVDVLTTNKTSFFREPEHFELLQRVVFPELAARKRPARIWSAGCSSGEEPYTIAMLARECLPRELADTTRVLATDVSSRIVRQAIAGEYSDDIVGAAPHLYRTKHFMRTRPGFMRVADPTRSMVRFAQLNLMTDWLMSGPFDVIFCRNVMIYFDRATQERLVQRFAALLAPGGHLFVGHSESLSGLTHGMRYVQPAVYAR